MISSTLFCSVLLASLAAAVPSTVPLKPLLVRDITPIGNNLLERSTSTLELVPCDQIGEKTCGSEGHCIPATWACCGAGRGGCSPEDYCSVSNGVPGCCPNGKVCSGGGGLDHSAITISDTATTTSTQTHGGHGNDDTTATLVTATPNTSASMTISIPTPPSLPPPPAITSLPSTTINVPSLSVLPSLSLPKVTTKATTKPVGSTAATTSAGTSIPIATGNSSSLVPTLPTPPSAAATGAASRSHDVLGAGAVAGAVAGLLAGMMILAM